MVAEIWTYGIVDQLVALIQYRKDFIQVYFCEVTDSLQYHPLNANQKVSNKKHFGSVSDSLDRLAATSECMASVKKVDISFGIMRYFIGREHIDKSGY